MCRRFILQDAIASLKPVPAKKYPEAAVPASLSSDHLTNHQP